MDQGWEDCDHFRQSPSDKALLSEFFDNSTLSKVWNAPKFTIELSYPPLDEHAEKCGDEDDTEACEKERIDSDGIGRWGELCSNIWA
jgi:hypothetical protein